MTKANILLATETTRTKFIQIHTTGNSPKILKNKKIVLTLVCDCT